MIKRLIFALLLFSPPALADYVIITACGEPIAAVFQDGTEVKVVPILALSNKELREKFLKVVDTEKGQVLEAESQYPIVCPNPA